MTSLFDNPTLTADNLISYVNDNPGLFKIYITSVFPRPKFNIVKLALSIRDDISFEVTKVLHNVFKIETLDNIISLFTDEIIPLNYGAGLPLALAIIRKYRGNNDVFEYLITKDVDMIIAYSRLLDNLEEVDQKFHDEILTEIINREIDLNQQNPESLAKICNETSKIAF